MIAEVTVKPPVGGHPRYVREFAKGVEWALRQFEKADAPPDKQFEKLKELILNGNSQAAIRMKVRGRMSDGPPELRLARRLGTACTKKKALSPAFWGGALRVCEAVTAWWGEHYQLEDDYFDKKAEEFYEFIEEHVR